MKVSEQVEIIKRGTVEIIREDDLVKKLTKSAETGQPLTIKVGFDPTAPDIHLGHTVLIQKMKHLQDLGHQVIFLIGDFTAAIGDPSGRSTLRKPISKEEIIKNSQTYAEQIFKILDKNKTKVVFNSEWMDKVDAAKLIEIAAHYTVARIIERDDFSKRYAEQTPIGIHEFLYPLIQGYDSVVLKADIEIGGSDQKFNLLVGRELQKLYGQESQVVITMPLLVGLDGVQKMSKSYSNYIGINEEPADIFGKVMSIGDDLMFDYYELLSDTTMEEIEAIRSQCKKGELNPMIAKKGLGVELTARFWGKEAGEKALADFESLFSKHNTPNDIPLVEIRWEEDEMWLPQLLKLAGTIESTSDGRRLIQQGAITVNDEKVTDQNIKLGKEKEYTVKVGKRRFIRIKPV
ncbi:MAG: tyrosine--tRNA ligase [Nitrospinota bacterium]|nr:tyrosine--tRNA ligase [Nitrospinota bacterium]